MQIFPTDEQLQELLETCGKRDEEEFISFELFARSVALLLEENADKISTSSQQEAAGDQEAYYGDEIDQQMMEAAQMQMEQEQAYAEAYGQQMEGEDPMEDPDYYEYDPDQVAATQQYQ